MSVVYLHRAVRRAFAEPARLAADATNAARLRVYLTDMLRPYGLPLDGDVAGAGQSYGEMAESVIADAVGPGEEVDLLVLAFAVPDLTPGRATATYLSHVCPGNPLAFAVCDQGRAAAYTGLRIVRDYGCRRALLVLVEQAHLPYRVEPPVELPSTHAAVALLLGTAPGSGRLVEVRTYADLSPEQARAALDRATVVPAEGQPLTGTWWGLAGELDRPGARRVVLADYDDRLRYLSTATFDLG